LRKAYECWIGASPRDSLIDIELKTTPHRFYRKLQKPEKSTGYWYKIQNMKFGRKNQKLSGFWVIDQFFAGFYLKFKF
jgi:hypothetical protein